MHSVFRIGIINRIDEEFWQVNLTLTTDNDQELTMVTQCIEKDISGRTGRIVSGVY
jgi:hypothetical protein